MVLNPWATEEEAMEGVASLWGYQESIEDLKHKLFFTTLELESLKNNAKEELRKNEETINQLVLLLQITSQERDEARHQLQMLLNKFKQPTPADVCLVTPFVQPESPQMMPIKANSSVTESESLSETPKHHHSHGSSPVESFFNIVETVPSPQQSTLNIEDTCHAGAQQQSLLQECQNSASMPTTPSVPSVPSVPKCDKASAIVDELASKRTAPEKGKFLQAVMEAGPLLQTLLVAGPLPRWRNPPPLQPFQIPPVLVKWRNLNKISGALSPNDLVQACPNGMQSEKCDKVGRQLCSPSMFSFGSGSKKRSNSPSPASGYEYLEAKRQRSQ